MTIPRLSTQVWQREGAADGRCSRKAHHGKGTRQPRTPPQDHWSTLHRMRPLGSVSTSQLARLGWWLMAIRRVTPPLPLRRCRPLTSPNWAVAIWICGILKKTRRHGGLQIISGVAVHLTAVRAITLFPKFPLSYLGPIRQNTPWREFWPLTYLSTIAL